MKRRGAVRGWVLAGLVSLMVLAGATSGVRAQDASSAEINATSLDDPGDGDRAIGIIGAAICGGEGYLIRINPLLGMNPWVLAGGIAGCLLMGLYMIT